MGEADKQENVTTFEEMAEVVARLGIVPLAPLIPEHPSVNGLTLAENWHTDTELDPWRWRVRFPGEGLAGYGKFIKKKPCSYPASGFRRTWQRPGLSSLSRSGIRAACPREKR